MVKRLYKDSNLKNTVLDDRHQVFDVYSSPCSICKHFQRDDFYCPAYPEGIPDSLLSGKEQHNQVRKDQKGTTIFEEDPD
jgi:hypothetical protein